MQDRGLRDSGDADGPAPRDKIMHHTTDTLFRKADMAMTNQQWHEAIRLYEALRAERPKDARVLYALGVANLQARQLPQALSCLELAAKDRAPEPALLHHLAMAYSGLARWEEACACLERLHAMQPQVWEIAIQLAETQHKCGRYAAAFTSYKKAQALRPSETRVLLRLGNCLFALGRFAEAAEYYQMAASRNPGWAEAFYNLSLALRNAHRYPAARQAAEKALSVKPDYPAALLNLGVLTEQAGDITGAAALYRQVLVIEPGFAEAYWSLANLRSTSFTESELLAMQALLAQGGLSRERQVYLNFTLAKYWEDERDYAKSFEYLQIANAQKRETAPYSRTYVEQQFSALRRIFTRAFMSTAPINADRRYTPIFIVGMPRSGTSLIEQILASHSQVAGCGELPTAQRLAFIDVPAHYQVSFPDVVTGFFERDWAALGAAYVREVSPFLEGKFHFTDKTPANFLVIGFLRMMFPSARFIHARRNPLDTCLSCYKQYFSDAQNFSYSLEDLAHYYHYFERLMAWWHSQLPGEILDLEYESLIGDQKGQTRRMLEFCGLPWEAGCLDFHRIRRAVQTASVGQVRQPLYATSVQSWKRYEPYIQTLIDALASYADTASASPEA